MYEYRGKKPQVLTIFTGFFVRERRTADPSAALGMTRGE